MSGFLCGAVFCGKECHQILILLVVCSVAAVFWARDKGCSVGPTLGFWVIGWTLTRFSVVIWGFSFSISTSDAWAVVHIRDKVTPSFFTSIQCWIYFANMFKAFDSMTYPLPFLFFSSGFGRTVTSPSNIVLGDTSYVSLFLESIWFILRSPSPW